MSKRLRQSYLLRLWREHDTAPVRATLIAIDTPDQPRHFATLDELFALLSEQAYPVATAIDGTQWDGDHCTPDGPC